MNKLAGKSALITGGGSGIGFGTAKLFIEQGARVAITGRYQSSIDEAQRSLGSQAIALQCDAGKLVDIERLMDTLSQRFGTLDILFVNAASWQARPFELVTEESFDAMAAVNFKGVFFVMQKALPLLAPNASIIVTTSIANQIGAANFSVYAACKAALRSLVQSLAIELIPKGIRVNAISPGPVDTPGFGRWDVPQEVVDHVRADLEQRSPMKRFACADEIAKMALFLAQEDASYCVGAEMVVDGGFSLLM